MRRAVRLAVLAAGVALAACGGGDDARESVDSYVREMNSVQRDSAPALKRAQQAYVAFSRNGSASPRVQKQLEGAETTLRATRAELADLRPPDEAAQLHHRVLRVYDLSAGLARETAQLGRYLPASSSALEPLPAAARRLRRGLKASTGGDAQRRVLDGYAATAAAVIADLRPLDPPPLLRRQHDAQIRQLQSARSLAVQLDDAIAAGDAPLVARLLLRFRRLSAGGEQHERDGRHALAGYRERYRDLGLAQSDVHRELGRIERRLD